MNQLLLCIILHPFSEGLLLGEQVFTNGYKVKFKAWNKRGIPF